MDALVSKGKGDEEYKEMFHDMYVRPPVVQRFSKFLQLLVAMVSTV